MRRHTFDPISAVLAAIALILGALVALDRIGPLDRSIGWWIAIAALVFGLALVPWGRRTVPQIVDPADPPTPDEATG